MSGLYHYKCPACGGTLEFDSATQRMKCPYCDTEVDIASLRGKAEQGETQSQAGTEDAAEGQTFSAQDSAQMDLYVCQSCGGEIIVPKTTGASSCPFCGNPQIMPRKFSGALRPDFIVPFKLDQKAVRENYQRHLTGKHFLPKVFKDENHFREIRGIYVPYWLFDSQVHGSFRYRGERIRRWEDANFYYTEHRYYDIIRDGTVDFAAVPVDGSKVMADDLLESLEPFSPVDAVEFDGAYLSGYAAHQYDVTKEEARPRALERMTNTTERVFMNTVRGYDKIYTTSSEVSFHQNHTRYVLYPVWLLNTSWRGERFTFGMNAQTGRLVGNLPLDKKAFYTCFALLTLVLWVVYTIGIYVLLSTDWEAM